MYLQFFMAYLLKHNNLLCLRGKESTEVRKSQIKGKESENSYQESKRSQKDRHTQTHGIVEVLLVVGGFDVDGGAEVRLVNKDVNIQEGARSLRWKHFRSQHPNLTHHSSSIHPSLTQFHEPRETDPPKLPSSHPLEL